MLPIPSDTNTIVSVIGIDPGTTNLGCGIISFDFTTNKITSAEAYTFRGDRLITNQWITDVHSDRTNRIAMLEEKLFDVLMKVNPICVTCESAFINIKRPAAYGALVEIISAIRRAVMRFDVWRRLYMVPPSLVKNAIGAKGGADKDAIKLALLKITDVSSVCLTPIEYMDEHSVDALAVAYAGYTLLIESRFHELL